MAKLKAVKKIEKPKAKKIKLQGKSPIAKIAKEDKIKLKKKNLSKVGLDNVKDEQKINLGLDLQQVQIGIDALFKLTKETKSKKLFDDEYPIFLQITSIKVPQCPDRRLRFNLKHSLVSDNSEICLIVPDIKRGRRVDHDPTIEHYEQILRTNDITNIKRVIPLHQIKVEYDQYELKRRLAGQYDHFLADGRICGHLSHLLGKAFYEKRKLPTPVHTTRNDLKKSIENALMKISMHIHAHGNSYIVQIGHSKMSVNDMTENFVAVTETLAKEFPGGWGNIRSLHIKTHLSMAIPVYLTLKSSNETTVPKMRGLRPKLSQDVTGELSTLHDKKISVTPAGRITILSNKKPKIVKK